MCPEESLRATGSEKIMQQVFTLDHADATRAIDKIRDTLVGRGKGAVIAVVDNHGELLGFLRVGDVGLPSINIAMNKAYTSARDRGPSGNIGRAVRDPQNGFDIRYFGDSRFIGWDGGMPIRVDGRVIGGIGVSGLTGEEDLELAQLGIEAIVAGLGK
jgi:glc operon protein GlcG